MFTFFWRKYLSKQECKLKNNLKLIIHINSPLFQLSDVSCNYAFIIINCLLKENAFELVPRNPKDTLSLTQLLTLSAFGCLQTACPGLWLAGLVSSAHQKPIPTSFTFPRTSGWAPRPLQVRLLAGITLLSQCSSLLNYAYFLFQLGPW